MRKALIIAVVLLVSLAAINTISAHRPEEGAAIHMTEKGFEPEVVTIKIGQSVVFENLENRERWPASNIHPTHKSYPNSDIEKCGSEEEKNIFDACRGLQHGQAYEFTFTNTGEWHFHDHLYPRYTGTIEVVESTDGDGKQSEEQGFLAKLAEAIKAFFNKIFSVFRKNTPASSLSSASLIGGTHRCMEGEKDLIDQCYDNLMAEYLINSTPKELLEAFSLAMTEDEEVRRDCHQIAHAIGRESLVVLETVPDVFDLDREVETCAGGLYHGAIEKLFRSGEDISINQHISLEEFESKVPTICADFETQLIRGECVHGIGHGALYVLQDMDEALGTCDLLPKEFDIFGCYSGVFMEYSLSGDAKKDNNYDTQYPCDEYEGTYRKSCYYVQTFRLTDLGLSDVDIINECRKAESPSGAFCVRGHGIFTLAHEVLAGKEAEMIALCESLDRTNGRICAEAIASRLASYSQSGELAMPFCGQFSNDYFRGRCLGYAADVLRVGYEISKDAIAEDCRKYLASPEECINSI